jgi:hypothetical protein
MKIKLYHIKETYENNRIKNFREVSVIFNEENCLVVHCCDMNATSLAMFDDFGVEFYLSLNSDATLKLADCLVIEGVKNQQTFGKLLLEKINDQFGGEDSCFENLMDYFKAHQIEYDYSRW